MVTSMANDQEDLQTYTVFLQFLHQHEQDSAKSLKAKLLAAVNDGLSCLCRLYSLLKFSQSPLAGGVTSSGVPDHVKKYAKSEDKKGWEVSYVTLTETKKRVEKMRKEYEDLKKTL